MDIRVIARVRPAKGTRFFGGVLSWMRVCRDCDFSEFVHAEQLEGMREDLIFLYAGKLFTHFTNSVARRILHREKDGRSRGIEQG